MVTSLNVLEAYFEIVENTALEHNPDLSLISSKMQEMTGQPKAYCQAAIYKAIDSGLFKSGNTRLWRTDKGFKLSQQFGICGTNSTTPW